MVKNTYKQRNDQEILSNLVDMLSAADMFAGPGIIEPDLEHFNDIWLLWVLVKSVERVEDYYHDYSIDEIRQTRHHKDVSITSMYLWRQKSLLPMGL